MAFLNPLFLFGAFAALLPVLVHLVRRTRAPRIEFPSLMFLRRIEQRTVRRRRLRDLLLLAVRCAALLLLALAFSRPYFSSSSAQTPASAPSAVILLDTSWSMQYPGVFEHARHAARNIIEEAGSGEQLAIVEFAGSSTILMPLKADPREAGSAIDRVEPGPGTTDYLQAIQTAVSILKDAGQARRTIHLISDFQDAGWNRSAPPLKLPPGMELNTVDVADPASSNLAVTEVRAEPEIYSQKYPGKITARLSSFTREPSPGTDEFTIELKLNDLTVERRQLKLEPNSSLAVEFEGFNVPEGSNRASIEIDGDRFPLDNRSYFTIRRQDQKKVLAIESASRGRSSSFYIEQAMLAGTGSPYSLTVKTPGTVNPAEVDSYRLIILNDPGPISDALAAAIRSVVERGGGLIAAAGKNTEGSALNQALGADLPAEVAETVRPQGGFSMMTQVKVDHPVFSPFEQSGRLASTRVYSYHRATPDGKAGVIAALDDGSPLIIEGTAGSGKVLLFTTSLDTSWNDLPVTPMFLPLIDRILGYLGGQTASSACIAGQVFTAPAEADGSLPSVERPGGGRVDDVRKNRDGQLSVTADEAGFYRLRYRDHTDYVASTLDTRESDLSKINMDEFLASLRSGPEGTADRQTPPRLTPEEVESGQRLWLPLMALALCLFVAESLLSGRIRIRKMIR